jgi:ATP-binding cassette, subfamily B, bacterial
LEDIKLIKKIIVMLNKYRLSIIEVFLLILITSIINFFIPILSKLIIDNGFLTKNLNMIMLVAFIILLLNFINSILILIQEKIRASVYKKYKFYLSETSFDHLLKLDLKFFNQKNITEILNNLENDINNIASIIDDNLFFTVAQFISILGGLIGLILINYRLALLILIVIPIKLLIVKYLSKERKLVTNKYISYCSNFAGWFEDTLQGIKEIKLFSIEKFKKNEFKQKQYKNLDTEYKLSIISKTNYLIDGFLSDIITFLIYILGSVFMVSNNFSIGSIFAFISYSTYVINPISAILNIKYIFAGIIPSAKRYFDLMSLKEENNVCNNKVINDSFKNLSFKDVEFSYNDATPIFKNINFTVNSKEKVVLLGPNGSGKTTILNLILRFIDVNSGKILLNGVNISDIVITNYRSLFSVVSQEIYLFDDTIKNNIKLYKENVSDNEIIQALIDSGLKKFIDKVSINYRIGPNGNNLSGGEKQKIALARALVHNNPIIVFDEATSNGDYYTEKYIQNLLSNRLKDNTVIIVTHKKNMISQYINKFIIFSNGNIEVGDYNYFISKEGIFNDLINNR